jgi:uridine kinase
VARELARQLGDAVVIGLDAYYRDQSDETEASIQVDIPDALDQPLIVSQLRALLRGEPIERPVYDYVNHSRTARTERIEPAANVVVEGLFTFYWEEVLELIDTRVFVFAEPGVCLERRIDRDVRERGRTREEVEEMWQSRVLPMYVRYVHPTRPLASIQLDGTRPADDLAAGVVASLQP